jgi:hypothetical protein
MLDVNNGAARAINTKPARSMSPTTAILFLKTNFRVFETLFSAKRAPAEVTNWRAYLLQLYSYFILGSTMPYRISLIKLAAITQRAMM